MSKIALNGNANGNGTFTIASPNSDSDRILNLPDSAGTLATAESTLTQFNASGSAPVFAARAWVNFNGTGTVAIRASGNVSSLVDNGTGQYTVNFTTALEDVNFCLTGTAGGGTVNDYFLTGQQATPTTTSARVTSYSSGGTNTDLAYINVAIFR